MKIFLSIKRPWSSTLWCVGFQVLFETFIEPEFEIYVWVAEIGDIRLRKIGFGGQVLKAKNEKLTFLVSVSAPIKVGLQESASQGKQK